MTEIEALRILFEIGQEITEKGLITQNKALKMGEAIGVLSVAVDERKDIRKSKRYHVIGEKEESND